MENRDLFLQKALSSSDYQLLLINNIQGFILLKFTWKFYMSFYLQIPSTAEHLCYFSAFLFNARLITRQCSGQNDVTLFDMNLKHATLYCEVVLKDATSHFV